MALHSGFAAVLIAAFASTASAQDVVRLKNGHHLSGTVVIDPAFKDGFKLVRWDTSATLTILWSQIPEAEKRRLLNKGVELPAASLSQGDTIDGIRVVTSGREVIGVLVKENESNLMVKTAANGSPIPVPVAGIIVREPVKIHEADAYSADEMIERRTKGVADGDAPKWIEAAKFAQALKLFDRAKEFFLKAAGGDAAKDPAVAMMIEDNTRLAKEDEAQKALAAARKLAEETKYEKALEEVRKLLETYAETETAKTAKTYLAELEKENAEFQANRAKVLGKKVPEVWVSVRAGLWDDCARMKKWSDAASALHGMDGDLVKKVSTKLNCSPEEAETFWSKREKKNRTVAAGAATWLLGSGQDGGGDLIKVDTGKADPVDDFIDKFGKKEGGGGGRGTGGPTKSPKPDQEKDLSKPLQSSEEWWAAASGSSRKALLEVLYASTSSLVERDEPALKPCTTCRGQGTLHQVRSNKNCEVHCPRCHGCKTDLSVTYR